MGGSILVLLYRKTIKDNSKQLIYSCFKSKWDTIILLLSHFCNTQFYIKELLVVQDFCFWAIWAAGPILKKKLGTIMSNFWGPFFHLFMSKKLNNEFCVLFHFFQDWVFRLGLLLKISLGHLISYKPLDSTEEGCTSCMKVSNYKEVFFKISKVLWTIKPQMNFDWNGKNGLLFFTRTSTGLVKHFWIKCRTNLGMCQWMTNYLSLQLKQDFFNLWLGLLPPNFMAETFHLIWRFRKNYISFSINWP